MAEFDDQTGVLVDRRWRRMIGVIGMLALAVALVDDPEPIGLVLPLVVPSAVVLLVHGFVVRVPWLILLPSVVVGPSVLFFRDQAEGGMFFLALVALLAVYQMPDRRIAAAVAAALVAVPAVAGLTVELEAGWGFWCLGIVLGWTFGHLGRQNRDLLVRLAASRRQAADRAALAERRRIAGDVHDLVGHSLSIVMLHVTGARRSVRRDPAGAERALQSAEEVGRASLAEIRRSVGLLRADDPAGALPSPDASDVAQLVAERVAAGQSITLDVHGDLAVAVGAVGLTVYRLAQESLANAAKHASGVPVHVVVGVVDDTCTVCVENLIAPSRRATPSGEEGYGLIGMRERVQAVGGTLSVGRAGQVWRVEAAVPVAESVGSS